MFLLEISDFETFSNTTMVKFEKVDWYEMECDACIYKRSNPPEGKTSLEYSHFYPDLNYC